MKRIRITAKNCVGCELCGIACSVTREGRSRETAMRIRIKRQFPDRSDRPFEPAVCRQCDKPKCAEACPTGALELDQSGQKVDLREDQCSGCGKCVEACPFSAIWMDPLRSVAIKCDLCGGDPQCVKFCRFQAIQVSVRAGGK